MKRCSNKEPNTSDLRIDKHVGIGNCRNERDEEFDISDSDIKEYKEAVHKLLKFRNYNVRASNGQFRCPFCVGVEKQEYHRLLQHAVRVAEGSIWSQKQRANHSAMAKYLVVDLASEADLLDTVVEEARQFRYIAAQAKRDLEQQEMSNFDFENKKQKHNCLEEDVDKREVALPGEKRKESWEKEVCSVTKADKWNAKKNKMAEKDPFKPKKRTSGFLVFMEDFQKTFKKQNPNVKKVATIGNAGAEMWTSLSQAEKDPYLAQAALLNQQYRILGYNTQDSFSSLPSSEEDDTFSSEGEP